MVDTKEIEKTLAEEKECVCSMMEMIAKITAADFDSSGEFDYESAHTVLLCDLVFKQYLKNEYKVAMETLALAFLMAGMNHTAELLTVASSGYTEEKGKYYLDRFFEYSDIYETYEMGRQIYADMEGSDGEDDSYM